MGGDCLFLRGMLDNDRRPPPRRLMRQEEGPDVIDVGRHVRLVILMTPWSAPTVDILLGRPGCLWSPQRRHWLSNCLVRSTRLLVFLVNSGGIGGIQKAIRLKLARRGPVRAAGVVLVVHWRHSGTWPGRVKLCFT